jgi:chromosome partitioning protein
MKTLAIVCQKGGVGKTTLAVNLAGTSVSSGYAVAIADTDPQATCTFWSDARGRGDIAIQPVFPVRLQHSLKALEKAGCDLAIIDTPPHAKDVSSRVIALADFVLIPTKLAAFDVAAMFESIEQCSAQKKPFAVVFSMCPPQEGEEYDLTMKALAQWQHEVCPVLIHHYVIYPRSQSAGQTVAEFDPTSKAAMEIEQLYTYTLKHLNMIPKSGARRRSA